MTKALLLLLSAVLVAAGVFIVWRDVHRRRREPFLVRSDTTAVHPEVEVVVARSEPDFALPRIARAFEHSHDIHGLQREMQRLDAVGSKHVGGLERQFQQIVLGLTLDPRPSPAALLGGIGAAAPTIQDLDRHHHLPAGDRALLPR